MRAAGGSNAAAADDDGVGDDGGDSSNGNMLKDLRQHSALADERCCYFSSAMA